MELLARVLRIDSSSSGISSLAEKLSSSASCWVVSMGGATQVCV